MNAFAQYLPSPDIRAHLETLGYTLTPREAASALWLTDALPLAEKHTKLRELLENAPELRGAADWDAMLAWEKAAVMLFTRRDDAAPFEAASWHRLETFDTFGEIAVWMSQQGLSCCTVGRSALPETAGLRARLGRGGAITRIESDDAPQAVRDAWELLQAENLRVPVPFKPGDTLYLCADETEWVLLEDTPLLLLETDEETGQAVCAAHAPGFPVDMHVVPFVFLRRPREGERALTNSLFCVSRYLRGAISLGELLTVYPSLFQLDTTDEWLRDGTYYGLNPPCSEEGET